MNTVIVTRHAGLVEWLKRRGIEGEVVAHADESMVKGKRVYGVLPYRLAALADEFVEVSFVVPAELRGKELTADDIDALNPQMMEWRVFGEDDAVFLEADAMAAQEQIGIVLDESAEFKRLLDDVTELYDKKMLEDYAWDFLERIDRALDSAMAILES